MQLALRRYPQMCEYGDEEMAKALPSAYLMSAAGGKGTLSNLLFEFIRGLVKVLRYTPQQLLVLIARDVFGQSAAAPGLTSKLSYFVVHIMQTSWTRVFIQTGNRAVSFWFEMDRWAGKRTFGGPRSRADFEFEPLVSRADVRAAEKTKPRISLGRRLI